MYRCLVVELRNLYNILFLQYGHVLLRIIAIFVLIICTYFYALLGFVFHPIKHVFFGLPKMAELFTHWSFTDRKSGSQYLGVQTPTDLSGGETLLRWISALHVYMFVVFYCNFVYNNPQIIIDYDPFFRGWGGRSV